MLSTFCIMSERRLQRRYKGVYKQYSARTVVTTWVLLAYIVSIIVAQTIRSGCNKLNADRIIFDIFQIALIVRWLLYWAIVAEMAILAATGSLRALLWVNDDVPAKDKRARSIILIALLAVESLTIVAYVVTHSVYPWMVRKQLLNAEKWWSIEQGYRHNSLLYRSKARMCAAKKAAVSYCGGLNVDGEPHGYGIWSDNSFHGEQLRGMWENGVPVGPFRSREHGSGYCFVNLRIGFCQNRGEEDQTDQIWFMPKHSSKGLQWGVASVECSVSGRFFRFLPAVNHLVKVGSTEAPTNASDCLRYLKTPMDTIRSIEETRSLLPFSIRHGEHLTQPMHMSLGEDSKEALIFLHGYNCSLDYALNRFGQLLALGDFPLSIHPFVFSWPSAGTLAYFQARDIGSESEKTALDFVDFIRSLVDAGYSSINIIAHSMGARVYFNCLSRGLLSQVFKVGSNSTASKCKHAPTLTTLFSQQVNRSSESESPPMKKAFLSTLTLCNPDYPRDLFVAAGGGYDLSRQFCDHITLYADNFDGALFYSELLSRKRLLDPMVYSLGKRVHMLHRDGDCVPRRHARRSRWSLDQDATESVSVELGVEAAELNQRGQFADVAMFAYNHYLDEHKQDGQAQEPRQYLDMDVIDTTWMDNNVHAIRHNYFNLNPTLVDDIHQLVVHKKRAKSRQGLMPTSGNVYIFLVAPSYVTNE
ncbi:TPA: hypothetical protein N0F65_005279 [Lagenidium giganteum]|uniref:Uncharacterized protein n=1 Tax=Lagenidium giganteum TaxID=4803 RepID=A0AAV2YXI0_9STRA|nr:TPA: hypothetical protein N0F65_005279 [Lagenidium giganteum]